MGEVLRFEYDAEMNQATKDLDTLREMAMAYAATHPEAPSGWHVNAMYDRIYDVMVNRGLRRTEEWSKQQALKAAAPRSE